jgi:hypothetical protein
MPTLQEEPLTQITLDLFSRDVATLRDLVGDGYNVKIREVVRTYCRTVRQHNAVRERLSGYLTQSTS